jgi:hypothetical protein
LIPQSSSIVFMSLTISQVRNVFIYICIDMWMFFVCKYMYKYLFISIDIYVLKFIHIETSKFFNCLYVFDCISGLHIAYYLSCIDFFLFHFVLISLSSSPSSPSSLSGHRMAQSGRYRTNNTYIEE